MTRTANPPFSAASSSSPLPSFDHPRSYAVNTSCCASDRRSGTGVPWSNSMRTYTGAKALRAACSRTARACSRDTPGNHSTNCDTCAPSSRFSNSAAIGTRVPRNTQAPLTRSGSRSTAGQEDQSIMGQIIPLERFKRRIEGQSQRSVAPKARGGDSKSENYRRQARINRV